MRGKITKIERQKSMDGGYCWFICFKMEDGHSGRCWIYEKNGNYRRWMPCIIPFQHSLALGKEVWLEKLQWWRDPSRRIVDADSLFQVVKEEKAA